MAQESILDQLPSKQLRLFVVWTPVLREDNRAAAVEAMKLVSDERVTHLWDADKSLGLSLGKTVTLPRERALAWDVYFVFDRTAKWSDAVPKPAFWMHQLGIDERTLRGEKLRSSVEDLLAAASPTEG